MNVMCMNLTSRHNQVTVCQGSVCLTVVGQLAKLLAVIVIIGLAVRTAGALAKLMR